MSDAAAERLFRGEIDWLLAQVPPDVLSLGSIRIVHYSYIPWHNESSISFGTAEDVTRHRHDPAAWPHFMAAQSDGSRVADLVRSWENSEESGVDGRLTYHRQLTAAARALVATDPRMFPEIPWGPDVAKQRSFVGSGGFPSGWFIAEVVDPDRSFGFNYCEYVLASRLTAGGSSH